MSSGYLVAPQEEHFSCMVELLGRAGQLEEEYSLMMCSFLVQCALYLLLAAFIKITKVGQLIEQEL